MKKLILLAAFILTSIGLMQAAEDYVLVTNAGQLHNNTKVLIVAKESNVACGFYKNGNNCPEVAITKSADGKTISDPVATCIFTLVGQPGEWSFLDSNSGKYLCSGTSGTKLQELATIEARSKANINISDGTASIVFQGTTTSQTLRYNKSSSIFGCYGATTTMAEVSLYKLYDPDEVVVEQAATPLITEENGVVTISSTDGDKADIYYTDNAEIAADTSNLSQGWILYTEPFKLTESATIYAVAKLKNNSEALLSEVVNKEITIEARFDPANPGNPIVWVAKKAGYTNAQDVSTVDFCDFISMTLAKGTNTSNSPKYYNTDGEVVRIYKGNTVTIIAKNGYKLKSVAFNSSLEKYILTPEDYESKGFELEGKVATWTGDASELSFSTTTTTGNQSQCRIESITITWEAPAADVVANPTITGETSFYDTTTATITVVEGDNAYYTLNQEVATANPVVLADWTAYTEPVTISETCTLYAIAARGENTSEVVSKAFTQGVTVANIAALPEATTTATTLRIAGPVTVVKNYSDKGYTYVRDTNSNASLLLFDITKTLSFEEGTQLSNIITNYSLRYSNPQGTISEGNYTVGEKVDAPAAVELTEWSAAAYNLYVEVKAAYPYVEEGKTYVDLEGTKIQLYNSLGIAIPEFEEGKAYILKGFGQMYNTTPQIIYAESELDDSVSVSELNAAAAAEAIYDLNGRQVSRENMSQGIYVIRQNGKTHKVIVK